LIPIDGMGGIILIPSVCVVVVVCRLMVFCVGGTVTDTIRYGQTTDWFEFVRLPQKGRNGVMGYISFAVAVGYALRNDSFVANHKFIVHSYTHTHTHTHTSKDT
jgi:hypothetical protein